MQTSHGNSMKKLVAQGAFLGKRKRAAVAVCRSRRRGDRPLKRDLIVCLVFQPKAAAVAATTRERGSSSCLGFVNVGVESSQQNTDVWLRF